MIDDVDDSMRWHPPIICQDCGKQWRSPRRLVEGIGADSAARVQGWTVWRENGGLNRQTVLCPKHRKARGIEARVAPLPEEA